MQGLDLARGHGVERISRGGQGSVGGLEPSDGRTDFVPAFDIGQEPVLDVEVVVAGDGFVDFAFLDQGDDFLFGRRNFRKVDAGEAVHVIVQVLQLARVEVLDFAQAVGKLLLPDAVLIAQTAQIGRGVAVLTGVTLLGIGIVEVFQVLEAVRTAHHDAERFVRVQVPLLQCVLVENLVAVLLDAAHIDSLAGIQRQKFKREPALSIRHGALRRIDAQLDARQCRLRRSLVIFLHDTALHSLSRSHNPGHSKNQAENQFPHRVRRVLDSYMPANISNFPDNNVKNTVIPYSFKQRKQPLAALAAEREGFEPPEV